MNFFSNKKPISLDWIIENRTIPLEVTNSLQEVADKYNYSVDKMNQYKLKIIDELYLMGKGYIAKFLFPNGINDNERWFHALIRMEVQRLHELSNSTTPGS
jgi:hypothetical protein